MLKRIGEIASEESISDIHLAVNEPVWVRSNGMLLRHDPEPLTDDEIRLLLGVILPGQDPYALLVGEHSEHDFSFSIGALRFRANLYKSNGMLGLSIRKLRDHIPELKDIGMPHALTEQLNKSKGLILVTGPTGSGKSTSLAACVNYINHTRAGHIITIEDPVEYLVRSECCKVTRREIGKDSRSFPTAVRAAMREDPDVIVIGELRDTETMHAALSAAETGHLVLATLHTNSAEQTVRRVTSLFPGDEREWARSIFSGVINCVVSQVLLKTKHGGRVLACEVMIGTSAIRQLIMEDKVPQISNVMETGRADGHVLLSLSIAEKVRAGLVELEEGLYCAHETARRRLQTEFRY